MKKYQGFLFILLLLTLTQCGGSGSTKGTYTEVNPQSPDTSAPFLSSVSALSSTSLSVLFSESVTAASVVKSSAFRIQGDGAPAVKSAALDSDTLHVLVSLSSPMKHGAAYSLVANGISDKAGNILATASAAFTGRGPVAAVLAEMPPSITNMTSAKISVSGDDIVSYQYRIGSGSWSSERAVSEQIVISSLPEGMVTLYAAGKDSRGNWQPYSGATAVSWTVDVTPPSAVLGGVPSGITNRKSAVISVSGEQVVAYKYRLQNGSLSDEYMAGTPVELSDLSDGNYSITVVSRDAAGNWQDESSGAKGAWAVDTTIPAAVLSSLASLTNSRSAAVSVSGTNNVSYCWRLDGGSWGVEKDISDVINVSGLAEGSHSIEVRAKNSAGSWQPESTPSQIGWIVDCTPPSAVFVKTPVSPSSEKNVSFAIGGDSVVRFRYCLDSGSWSGYQDAASPLVLTDMREGVHSLSVCGIDAAGNEQSRNDSKNFSWTADFTAPAAVLSCLPDSLTNQRGVSIAVSGADCVSYKYELDSGNWSSESSAAVRIILGGLADGLHSIKVVGCDSAGNWQEIAASTLFSWTVDTVPPSASGTNLPSNPCGTPSISVSVAGDDAVGYLYSIDGSSWIEKRVSDTIDAGSLSEGNHSLFIKGKDAAGNIQPDPFVYSWRVDLTAPSAVISEVPSAKNNLSSITFSVSGDDVIGYRYSLDGSSFSSETAAGIPFQIQSIAAGHHEVTVIGRDAAGNWQNQNAATLFAWDSDFTAPTAVLSGCPAPVTNNPLTAVSVSGEDLVSYRCRLDGGQWIDGGFADIISKNVAGQGRHSLDVIGIDSYGNVQPVPTSYSWTVDTISPASASVSDSGTVSSATSLLFSWTTPSDAVSADIQISADSSFSTILFENSSYSVTQGSSTFAYSASEGSAHNYYARVRFNDAAGNIGNFGGSSDGIVLVGSLSGIAKDSYGAAVAGAAVSVALSGTVFVSGSTGSDGSYSFDTIPAGVSNYSVSITKSGFTGATKANVAVHTGSLSDLGILTLVTTAAQKGIISGTVVNANDGAKMTNAAVSILDYKGTSVSNTVTAGGTFKTGSLNPGTYSAVVTLTNYLDLRVDNITVNGDKNIGSQAICEKLSGGHVRVVLLWGSSPTDLDLHAVGPSSKTVSDGAPNTRFHVYWKKKSFDAANGKYEGESGFSSYTSALVQDSTSGYGPEAVNTWNLYSNGVYTFTVHDYANTDWYQSSPVIRIYDSLGLMQEIPLPSGAGTQRYWKVFQLNIQGETRDKRVISVSNQFATLDYTSKSSMDWQMPQGGVSGYLLSVAKGEHPFAVLILLFAAAAFSIFFLWNRRRTKRHEGSC